MHCERCRRDFVRSALPPRPAARYRATTTSRTSTKNVAPLHYFCRLRPRLTVAAAARHNTTPMTQLASISTLQFRMKVTRHTVTACCAWLSLSGDDLHAQT